MPSARTPSIIRTAKSRHEPRLLRSDEPLRKVEDPRVGNLEISKSLNERDPVEVGGALAGDPVEEIERDVVKSGIA